MTTSVANQTMDIERFASEVDRNGWATIEKVVDDATLDEIDRDIAPFIGTTAARGGVRNLLDTSSAVRKLAQSRTLRALASSVLGSSCAAVRVIYFDKTPGTNWRVIWHQDLSIAVEAELFAP